MKTITRSPRRRTASAQDRNGIHNSLRASLVLDAVVAEYIRDISARPRHRGWGRRPSGVGVLVPVEN
jgi:hypothetical protein